MSDGPMPRQRATRLLRAKARELEHRAGGTNVIDEASGAIHALALDVALIADMLADEQERHERHG